MSPPNQPPPEQEPDLARLLLAAWKAKRFDQHPDQLLTRQLELGFDKT